MNPALNGSAGIQRFKHNDVIQKFEGIIFDFYTGQPHMKLLHQLQHDKT